MCPEIPPGTTCCDDHLLVLLSPHIEERKLGKIICEQDYDFDGNAHGPDVSFIGAAKLHLIRGERRVQLFVPDLAIEIASESDMFVNLMQKVVRYRKCGTKEVWSFAWARVRRFCYPKTGNRF